MPYRRLPNTDTARIRAMKTALGLGKEVPPHKLAYSSKTLVHMQRFLGQFENSLQLQRQTLSSQEKKAKNHNEVSRKARMYLTHFIKVMNMAIFRGELPPETRAFYGIPTDDPTVPSFSNENELVSWGRRIIDGEIFRIKKGGSPITNPTIAVVKVRFEQYLDILNFQNIISKRGQDYSMKVNELRKEADEIILTLWNEVESKFLALDETERRAACENYGLVYFFRKGELEKALPTEQTTAIALFGEANALINTSPSFGLNTISNIV
jgi:hypothetical protein